MNVPDSTRPLTLVRVQQREPETFKMNLIDAPINAQEQNDEYAANNTTDALRDTEYGRQHKLPLVAADSFHERAWLGQPSEQLYLEQAAFQPQAGKDGGIVTF